MSDSSILIIDPLTGSHNRSSTTKFKFSGEYFQAFLGQHCNQYIITGEDRLTNVFGIIRYDIKTGIINEKETPGFLYGNMAAPQ